MAEWGLLQGLARSGQYNEQINDLRFRQEADRRAQAAAQQRAQEFADGINMPTSMNPYDSPRLRAYALDKMKQLGQYYQANPDARYNPMKQLQIKAIKADISDNPISRRARFVDSAYAEYLKDRAEAVKNPEQWDIEALDAEGARFKNYFQYGHPLGEEGILKEGEQPVVYSRPQAFIDENELFKKTGNAMQARGFESIKNGRDGAFRTYATDQDLKNEATLIYQSRPRQFDVRYRNKGIDPISAIMEGIRPYVKTDFDIGDKNKLGEEMALAKYKDDLKRAGETPGASAYDISILNRDYATVAAEDLDATFGSKLKHVITNGVDPPTDNTGDTFHYTGDIYDNGYRKDGKYQKTGEKVVDGYVYKPIDWSIDHGIVDDKWFRDDKVNGEWAGKAEIVNTPVDKDGKSEKVVKIKVNAIVNGNAPVARGKFDKHVMTTKQREGAGIVESSMNQTYEGRPVGSIVETTQGNYLVTANGYIKQ